MRSMVTPMVYPSHASVIPAVAQVQNTAPFCLQVPHVFPAQLPDLFQLNISYLPSVWCLGDAQSPVSFALLPWPPYPSPAERGVPTLSRARTLLHRVIR